MLKKINYFIMIILSFEFISFIIGYGTHYEHYKFTLMLLFLLTNTYFLSRKRKMITQPVRSK